MEANAIVCPNTEMIHLEHASAQIPAMVSSRGFKIGAMRAESVFLVVFSTDEMNR